MSFIYKDYLGPKIIAHAHKVTMKSLFGKMCKRSPDGSVFDILQWYAGDDSFNYYRLPTDTDSPTYIPGKSIVVRHDKQFKRFVRGIGMTIDKLNKTENKGRLRWIGFVINPQKFQAKSQTAEYMAAQFNSDYLNHIQPIVETDISLTYDSHITAGQLVGVAKIGVGTLKFANGTATSDDGYYTISDSGIVTITESAITDKINIVKYNGSNTRTYTLTRTYVDVDKIVKTANGTITITPIREYIDVKITIGGVYTKTPRVTDAGAEYSPVEYGVPDMMTDLVTLRATIEKDPIVYLGNIQDTVPVDVGGAVVLPATIDTYANATKISNVSQAVGNIEIDVEHGNLLDVCALLDNGTVFELVNETIQEKKTLVPVKITTGYDDSNNPILEEDRNVLNMEYSYIKRYRVKANSSVNSTSKIIVDMHAASEILVANANYMQQNFGRPQWQYVNPDDQIKVAYNNAATDSIYKVAITQLNGEPDVFNPEWFEGTDLKVSAFNEMNATQFFDLLTRCLDYRYDEEKGDVWGVIVGIVVIIIIIVIVVVVAILTGGTGAGPAMQLGIAIAGSVGIGLLASAYAKNFPQQAGMIKMVGFAAQAAGIAIMVISLGQSYDSYLAGAGTNAGVQGTVQTAITMGEISAEVGMNALAYLGTEATILTVAYTAETIAAVAGILSQMGIGDEKFQSAMMIIGATAGITALSVQMYQSGILTGSIIKDVSKGIKLLENGTAIYSGLLGMSAEYENVATEEQSIKEDGVEQIYAFKERTMENDVLFHMSYMKEAQFGGARTEALIGRNY